MDTRVSERAPARLRTAGVRGIASVAVLALFAVACSSTASKDGAKNDALTPGAPGGSVAAGAPGGASASPSQPPGGTAPTSTSPTSSIGTRIPGGKADPTHPGITPTKIFLGVQFTSDADAAYGLFGSTGQDSSDTRGKMYSALVDYINKHGGIAGRQVALVFHPTETASATSWEVQGQAACSTFTEDNKVFAAIIDSVGTFGIDRCLASRNTIAIEARNTWWDQKQLSDFAPYVYWPGHINGSRYRVYVDGLAAQGFFDPGAKIGLLRYDSPVHKRVTDGVVKPALASHGLKVTAEYEFLNPQRTSDVSRIASEIGNAIIRFRQAKITHVLFVGTQGAVPFLFLPAAQAQGFRPRYGFNSGERPEYNYDQVPAQQLHRALSVGWAPELDVDFAQDPGGNPQAKLCLDIFQKAGITAGNRDTEGNLLEGCDAVFFLKRGLERASTLTPQGLRAAVDGLGGTFGPAFSFATRWGPRRYDGAAAVRYAAFDDGCGCFIYTGALHQAP